MIASPLNYTGGKFKLLPQLLPLFPGDTDTFVDLFCGGCNVGLNAPARQVIYNDIDPHLIRLYDTLRRLDRETVFQELEGIIDRWQLSRVSRYGYAHYGCTGSGGLTDYNRERYLALRADLNRRLLAGETDDFFYLMFYVAIVYAFNNMIRYNRRGEYNLPVGKRDFNRRMSEKLSAFLERIQAQDCRFTCQDFRTFDAGGLGPGDFVYADPPYLITRAAYNERGGWQDGDERDLLDFLDGLDARRVRFGLSNVLRSRGRENRILLNWLEGRRDRYQALRLRYSYANSSYHIKDRSLVTEEVLIVNYTPEGTQRNL